LRFILEILLREQSLKHFSIVKSDRDSTIELAYWLGAFLYGCIMANACWSTQHEYDITNMMGDPTLRSEMTKQLKYANILSMHVELVCKAI
jgi:hypothetical protein